MAQRRMFSRKITDSARFLRLSAGARLLWYDLGMAADDDGIAEGYTVMRMNGCAEDDLKELETKGFVKILNDDLVTQILDWKVNNLLKNDRYVPSIYAELVYKDSSECFQNGSKVEPNRNQIGTQMEPDWNTSGTQMEPKCFQNGSKVEPQVNLVKVNKGQDRLTKVNQDQDNSGQDNPGQDRLIDVAPIQAQAKQRVRAKLYPEDDAYWNCFQAERDIAKTFWETSGIAPNDNEFGRWKKELRNFTEAGITCDAVSSAIKMMIHDGLTIGTPGSVFKTARSIMINGKNKKRQQDDDGKAWTEIAEEI